MKFRQRLVVVQIFIVLMLTLAMGIHVFIEYADVVPQMESGISSKAHSCTRELANVVDIGIAANDVKLLKEDLTRCSLKNGIPDPDFSYVIVTDQNGKMLAALGKIPRDIKIRAPLKHYTLIKTQEGFQSKHAIFLEGRLLGYVLAEFSFKNIVQVQNRMLIFSYLGLFFSLLSVAASILFVFYFVKPIRSIINHVHCISNGDLSKTLNIRAADELGQLVRDLNQMTDNLANSQRVVCERTESLRIANKTLQNEIAQREQMETKLRLAQKLEAVGQLAAGIAHEINTPTQYIGDNLTFLEHAFGKIVNALMNYQNLLEVAEKGGITQTLIAEAKACVKKNKLDYLLPQIPRSIEQSLEGTQRVATIVRAMKEFSHPSTGEKEVIDIHHAIQNTLTVARNEWKYVAEVKTEFDPAMPSIECLPGEFNQVILNIIVNAAHSIGDVTEKSGKGKGTITIATRADGDFAEIRIRDTGTGIPEEIKSKIFDPFFTTKQVGKGTGQGLAIAYSVVVDKHRGTIDVESEVGRGTTFIIRLPITAHFGEKEKES